MSDAKERFIKLVYGELSRDPADYADPMAVSLFDDLGADSLDAIELTMDLEEDFGVEITEAESQPLTDTDGGKTVGDWWALVEAKLAAKAEG